ncbi:MAG: branched-chain amino acid ABC transporter permease, partial [Betaproteobacteria bacterium]
MRDRVSKVFLFSFAVIIFLMLPLVADRFYVQFASKILVMIIFASSLNLLVGYCGLVSLGHAAFFGFSGYVLALISPTEAGVNFMLGLLASVLGAACLAAIIGSLVIRTKGIFFIMAT